MKKSTESGFEVLPGQLVELGEPFDGIHLVISSREGAMFKWERDLVLLSCTGELEEASVTGSALVKVVA